MRDLLDYCMPSCGNTCARAATVWLPAERSPHPRLGELAFPHTCLTHLADIVQARNRGMCVPGTKHMHCFKQVYGSCVDTQVAPLAGAMVNEFLTNGT